MKEELEKTVKDAAKKACDAKTGDEAMKYAQAALNAAHALSSLAHMDK